MKVKFAILSPFVIVSSLFVGPAFAQSTYPTCQSSASDTDSDGYGWENDMTCLVEVQQAQQTQCEDRGGYPWGWNPVTLTSCRLDEQPGECVDADGDGVGWNGTQTCIVEFGSAFEQNIERLIEQENNVWRCRTNPIDDHRSTALDIFFHRDGVVGVGFLGIGNQVYPLPSGPETHPGSWSRGYPVVDGELHINGTFSYIDPERRYEGRYGPYNFSNQYQNNWQIILKGISFLSESVSFNSEVDNPVSFTAQLYYKDYLTDGSYPVTCSTSHPLNFNYVPFDR